MRRVITSIFHVAVGTVTPHVWTQAITQMIRSDGADATVREVVRSFNEAVESLGQFDEALDEDTYAERFASTTPGKPSSIATALLNDLLPRARQWSSSGE